MSEKTMQFANFNITYLNVDKNGKSENIPMLRYFKEIILPAFKQDYSLKTSGNNAVYMFNDVQIENINDEYCIAGNFIKSTVYEVNTQYENNQIIPAKSIVPTAPYSRFIIFLKNHRMVLVKNEKLSPDIRSFQRTYRSAVNHFISVHNKNVEKHERFPDAIVNIVDIPMMDDIKNTLKDVKKIHNVKLRFFPLNNDMDFTSVYKDVRNVMGFTVSNSANLTLNSPKSKENVCELLYNDAGLVEPSIDVTTNSGEHTTIKSNHFTSSASINVRDNIEPQDDKLIFSIAKSKNMVSKTSKTNEELYNNCLEIIENLCNKKDDDID